MSTPCVCPDNKYANIMTLELFGCVGLGVLVVASEAIGISQNLPQNSITQVVVTVFKLIGSRFRKTPPVTNQEPLLVDEPI